MPFNKKTWYIEKNTIGKKSGRIETFVPAARPKKNHPLLVNEKLFFFKKYKNKDKKNIWSGSGFGIVIKYELKGVFIKTKKAISWKNLLFRKDIERRKVESDKNKTPEALPEKIKPGCPKNSSGKKPIIALMFQ